MAKTEFRIWYNTKDDKKHKKSNIHIGWSIQVQRGKTTPWYINLMDANSWRCSTFAPDPQLSLIFNKLQELNASLDEGRKLVVGEFDFKYKGKTDVQWTAVFDPSTPSTLQFFHWEGAKQEMFETSPNELNNAANLICLSYDNSDALGLGNGPWI